MNKKVLLLKLTSFCRWATENKVNTQTQPATFGNGVRGLAASTDLLPGSIAVTVPAALLITQNTARESDLVMLQMAVRLSSIGV